VSKNSVNTFFLLVERMISDQQFGTTFFLLITENAMDNMPFCLSQNMFPEKTSNFERLTNI